MDSPRAVVRVANTQATLNAWRDQEGGWGRRDCARMVAQHLKRFGYRVSLAKAGGYTTEAGARRALQRAGYESLEAALDAHGLARITPAATLVGDILAFPSPQSLPALSIVLRAGATRVLHCHDGYFRIIAPTWDPPPHAAWRVV